MKTLNKIISSVNGLRYQITEPLLLKRARERHAQQPESMDAPLISICLPTYNRADILMERAVDSVLKQTWGNFELIIVDDGSTDRTPEKLSQIEDVRVNVYHIERSRRYPPTPRNHWFAGPVVALNEALKHVRGQWIARIDDDDIWTDDHLEALLMYVKATNSEFVSASYIEERKGNRTVMNHTDCHPRIGGVCTWLYRSYLKFFKYNINCWRKDWNKVNDTDICNRMYKAGVSMIYVDRVVAYILPRPGETTVGLDAYLGGDDGTM